MFFSFKSARWLAAAVAIFTTLILGSASAQDGFTGAIATDKRLLRWQYFNQPRAFPASKVSAGAFQRARTDFDRKWGAASRAIPTGAFLNITGWTALGPAPIGTSPTTAGRINSVAVHPTTPSTVYIGAATGGVWKTTDGGSTWSPMTDSQCSLAMGSVVIDPVNPNIVYAGTGEQNFSLDSYYGCGVLRSTDGGATWTQLGGSIFDTTTGGAAISRVVIDPSTAGSASATKVYAATSFGLYVSTNSGSTWAQTLASTPVTDLVVDPSNPSVLYASVGYIFGSTNNGVYKSTNGGTSWTKLAGGLPTTSVGRINLGIAPSSSSTLYAGVMNTSTFGLLGLWKTTDGGASWTQLSATNASCATQCWYDMHVYVSPTNANTVFFGGFSLYRSTDGGSSFTDVGTTIHVDHHGFGFQPGNASVAYATSDGGVFKTTDGGSSWSSVNGNLAVTQFYAGAALHPTDPNTITGGTQDNGTLLSNGSSTWNLVIGGDGGYSAIDQSTPTTRYGETQWVANQSYIGPRRSDAGGSYNQILSGISISDRGAFIPPLVMSQSNSQRLYFGTYRLYRTTNQGTAWSVISTDLTGGGTISAIAEAKSNSSVIYVGTNDGRLQVTTNGGSTWSLLNSGLPSRAITAIAVHPTDANTAFATVSGFGSGHVFKTTNAGASWSDISSNLPDIPTNAIVLNPAAPTTEIIIGTDLGVFRTTDGLSWASFNIGLPNVPVYDLVYNTANNLLVAATHGRGMFKANMSAGGPVLAVTPSTDLVSTGNVGGPFSPASATYTLQNSGTGTMSWTASSSNTTVATVSPASGSLAAGSSTTVTVSIAAAATGLSAGSYSSTITFTNSTNGSGNATRTASLTVNNPGGNNDNFANAFVLSGSSGTTTGDNSTATHEASEPLHYTGTTGTKSVWWKWVAPATGQATFSTAGSNFDTVLSIYSGSSLATLTQLMSNDDYSGLSSRVSLHVVGGTTYYIAVDGYSASSFGSITLAWSHTSNEGPPGIAGSILPYARSVQVGTAATAFANIVNVSGVTATACYLQMPSGVAVPGTFVYRTADSSNNLTGTINTPIDIPNGATQNFVFGFTPSAAFAGVDIPLVFDCENQTPVATAVGVNTFLLSASSSPSPDLVAIGATPTNDGIVRLPSTSGSGFFATAAVNIGVAGTITASADDGGRGLPLTLTICQTNSTTGACLSPPAASTTSAVANNQTVTYAVFVQASGAVAFNPATNRLFMRLKEGTATRGATHVAVCTGSSCPAAPPPPALASNKAANNP